VTRDVTASIKARLLNRARQEDGEFELFLVRYACERFLYRLGASSLRENCILKGAGLLTVWMDDPYRATRDVDLLAFGASDEASIREIVKTVCAVPCPEDGLVFDLESPSILPIRAEEEYQGQRAVLRAWLGKARIRVQVDFGFGDAIVPPAEETDYPTLLEGLPAPRLRAYPRVVTVAEKFQAMVDLGRRNSRMKDFHDIWALSSEFQFDGVALREAVTACFERRRTAWTAETPDVLSAAFYTDPDLAARWAAYLRAGAFRTSPPDNFKAVGERVHEFLGPVRKSIVAGEGFKRTWSPGGPWQ
jgi:hypothetical protein